MAAKAEPTEPIKGYDDMTVAEIVDEMDGMTDDEVQAVKDYEAEGKARKGVLSFGAEADSEPHAETKGAAVKPKKAPPVTVDNRTARSDEDGQLGQWVDIVSGDYAGRRGSYMQTLEHDDKDGFPVTILVRSRDANNEPLVVDYSDVRPTEYTGGR